MPSDTVDLLVRYRALLAGDTPHLLRSVELLPAGKDEIAAAIKQALRDLASNTDETADVARGRLKDGYAQLAFFVDDARLLQHYEREMQSGISGVGDDFAEAITEHDRLANEIEALDSAWRSGRG